MRLLSFLLGSFFLVAFGQPSLIPGVGMIAAALGLALFWRAMLFFPTRKGRFLLALVWFAAVQAVQLSWMTSMQYMGPLILLVYAFLILAIGCQFGLLSFFLAPGKPLTSARCFAISGCWVLFEWARLFPCTGFTWNPIGFCLADSPHSIQLASLLGMYGLSFWVICTNLFALNALFLQRSARCSVCWLAWALFPYLFGVGQKMWIERTPPAKIFSVALVQTAFLPEQKEDNQMGQPDQWISPLRQWERVWELLSQQKEPVQLVVLPESAISFGARRPLYPLERVQRSWRHFFGTLSSLPALQEPWALPYHEGRRVRWRVTNAFLAQALANQCRSDLILGLDDEEDGKRYNAAFYFRPRGSAPQRYEKRILMPVVEYIPLPGLSFLKKFIFERFGIGDSFTAGREPKVFACPLPAGISICAEETYSHLMRQVRRKGAELFVSVANDSWFPHTDLPKRHLDHGRVRAVENGVPLLRACNTGVTGIVDCFGQMIASLKPSEEVSDVLFTSVPGRSYKTLYTFVGDVPILIFSFVALLLFWRKNQLL